MEKGECKSCCATKDIEGLMVLKLVRGAGKRSENATTRIRMNITKREERKEQKGVSYAKDVVTE